MYKYYCSAINPKPHGRQAMPQDSEGINPSRTNRINDKIVNVIRQRAPNPCQALFAVFLAGLADAGVLNQAVTNFLAKSAAPRLHAYLKAMNLVHAEGKNNTERLKNLLENLNSALEIGPKVELHVVSNDSAVEVGLGGDGCKYCPRAVGLAEIPWAACPFPKLIEGLARREGIPATAVPRRTRQGLSYVEKKNGLCWITIKLGNENTSQENREPGHQA
jgi:hypothetical protein